MDNNTSGLGERRETIAGGAARLVLHWHIYDRGEQGEPIEWRIRAGALETDLASLTLEDDWPGGVWRARLDDLPGVSPFSFTGPFHYGKALVEARIVEWFEAALGPAPESDSDVSNGGPTPD